MDLTGLLLAEGLAERPALERAHDRAARDGLSLAAVLVDDGIVPEDVLADAVARAVGTVVFDLARGTLDAEAVHLVPESVARRHLAIGVAPDPARGALRVAFADPLDQAATRAVRDATGLEVSAVVGTVAGIRSVIDREFGRRVTATLPRPELPPESTQRMADGTPLGRPATEPSHRIAEDATLEQRHEALVLALIEAGVLTRADYAAALRRLLGRKD